MQYSIHAAICSWNLKERCFPKSIETNVPEILTTEKVRILIPYNPELAHYNAAVIRSRKNPSDILILVREVPIGPVKVGIPDFGNLIIYRSTPEKVEQIAKLNLSDPNVCNWEDARAFQPEGDEEKVIIGLTAIRKSDNKPVAAMLEGNIVDGNFSIDLESLVVCLGDEGKNVTPISPTQFLFRREGSCDSLEVAECGKDENGRDKLMVIKTIKFPKKSWCEEKIGTQAQILPGMILPIHGVSYVNLGIDPETGEEVGHHAYSMGLAQLDENLNVIKITDTPLFTRESFKNILPMGTELDANKDVIYCCGYLIEGDMVNFIINIGDLMTVEVSKSMTELRERLEKSSPIISEEMPDKAV